MLTLAERLAEQILWHDENVEFIRETAERHNNTFEQELDDTIEEFTQNETGETDKKTMQKVKQLLKRERL